jgi:hypothetical protein
MEMILKRPMMTLFPPSRSSARLPKNPSMPISPTPPAPTDAAAPLIDDSLAIDLASELLASSPERLPASPCLAGALSTLCGSWGFASAGGSGGVDSAHGAAEKHLASSGDDCWNHAFGAVPKPHGGTAAQHRRALIELLCFKRGCAQSAQPPPRPLVKNTDAAASSNSQDDCRR